MHFQKFSTLVAATAISTLSFAADKKGTVKLNTDQEKASYIIGYGIGTNIKNRKMDINPDILGQAILDAIQGKKSPISQAEEEKIMTAFETKMRGKMEAESKDSGDKNTKIGKEFLDKNAKEKGITVLPSGLQYKVIKEGTGAKPALTDTVTTHYKGTLIDGTEFDSSYKRNEPATFPVNGVIKGWTEALQLMKVGSKWQLFIPSELAYGSRGAGQQIGPNSTLIFEVELISIKGK